MLTSLRAAAATRRHRTIEMAIENLELRRMLCFAAHSSAVPHLTTVDDINAYAKAQSDIRIAEYLKIYGTAGHPETSGLPQLNSRPGAPAAIYLDFDGDVGQAVTPYDVDGDSLNFNAAEQTTIAEAWRQITMYVGMFDVNVTTIQPAAGTPFAWHCTGNNISGGYSYVNVFPNSEPESFNQSGDARTRVSGIAHELGHNFGLQHQGDWSNLGVLTAEYSSGYDNLHGPIMGVDYAQNVHKWFNFHPSNSASNTQDDAAIIAADIAPFQGGDGFVADDFAGTIAGATALTVNGSVQSRTAIIERISDIDSFSFTSSGAVVSISAYPESPAPVDLKLEIYRSDGTLVAASDNAANPQQLTLSLTAGTYYALVSSHGNFGDHGQYVISARQLPAQWNTSDIGSVLLPGTAGWDSSTGNYTLAAAGSGISGNSDLFRFAFTQLTGNGSITARVNSMTDTNTAAKAGIMIRESLAGGSKHALLDLNPTRGSELIARTTTNGSSTNTLTAGFVAPYWLRLTRAGSTITAERSIDGSAWTSAGSASISMTSTVYVGLAVTANAPTSINTSVFSNVSFTGTIGAPAPTYNALPAPTSITVNPGTGTGLNIAWINAAGNAGYAVERSSDGINFTQIGTTTTGVATYSDPNLAGALRYFYRVCTLDGTAFNSVPSIIASGVNRPSAVTSLGITSLSTTQLVVNWIETTGETGYRVERSLDQSSWSTVATLGANVRSFSNTGLVAATTYFYRVTPLSAAGDGTSSIVSGSTRLAAVSGLTFTNKAPNEMAFSWTDIAAETAYRIDRSTDGTTYAPLTSVAANQTSYADTTVLPLREYYYRVVGTNALTESVSSSSIYSATPSSSALPAPWISADIGSVGGTGAAGLASGTFTIISAGSDIAGTSDQMRYTYQPLNGDGQIIARVSAVEATANRVKIGVMIRESLANNARNVMVAVTAANGLDMQYRSSTGGTTSTIQGPDVAAPYWVKLVRAGTSFTGYSSTDGFNWTLLGTSPAVSMPTNVFIGLGSDAGVSGVLNTSAFTNVLVASEPSATPGIPDLMDVADLGTSPTDNLTSLNNSPGKALRFSVSGTFAGASVSVYANGILVGTATASGSTTEVLTDGTTLIADGLRQITATQTEVGKAPSPVTAALPITIDSIAPSIVSTRFLGGALQSLRFTFNDNVQASLLPSDLSLTNTSTAQSYNAHAVAWDSGTNAATFSFPVSLADGVYVATLPGANITDAAGNGAVADANYRFVWVAGTVGNDVVRIDRDITAALLQVYVNSATPTFSTAISGLGAAVIAGNNGADSLTIDLVNGNVSPADGVDFDGQADADTLKIFGTAAAQTASFNIGVATVGSAFNHANVEAVQFDGLSGWDTVNVNGGASVTFTGTQRLQTLSIGGNAAASLAAGGDKLLVLRNYTLAGTGKIDLHDNDLLVDYPGPTKLNSIRNSINAARAGGAWTGNGITSSAARFANPAITTLGIMEATDYKALYGSTATFNGESLDDGAVLVKYTYYGDSDLSGSVDFDDYVRLDNGFNNNQSGWLNGDADQNGNIDFDDYVLIDSAFNGQTGVL